MTPDPRTIAIKAGRGTLAPGTPLRVPPVLASVFHAGGETTLEFSGARR